MSGLVRGRPGRRRFEPSYVLATSVRYHRRMVSGCHDANDVLEAVPAEDLAFDRQTPSLIVGQARSSSGTVRRAEYTVLLKQVVNHGLLLAIGPAGEQEEEEGERERQRVHRGSVHPGRIPVQGVRDGVS